MEMARCIILLPQLFLHLFFIFTDVSHLSFNQFFSYFNLFPPFHLWSALFTFSTDVPLPLSKHLPQVLLKHNHTTLHYLPLPAYLLLPSIPTCLSAPLYSCPPALHCASSSPQIFLLFSK